MRGKIMQKGMLEKIMSSKKKTACVVALAGFICVLLFLSMAFFSLTSTKHYDIGELNISQDKTCLSLSWNNAGTPKYKIIVLRKGKRPRLYTATRPHAKIEAKELGIKYGCIVLAENDKKMLSSAKIATLNTHKLKQKVHLEKDFIEGVKGNQSHIKAAAHGEISYIAIDEKFIKINNEGVISFKEKGETKAVVTTPEGPQYKAAHAVVNISVFPDKLDTPSLNIKYSDDLLSATITWEKIPYAKEYILMLRNPVTGEYQSVGEYKEKDTKAKVHRKQGSYKLMAKSNIDGKTIQSEPSKKIKVKSVAEDAKTYTSSHNLRTLDLNSLQVITGITGVGSASIPQSMSQVGDNYVIAYVDRAGRKGALVTYTKSGERVGAVNTSGMGHANGSTYCPVTDKIYTVKTHKAIWSPSCTTYKLGDGYRKEDFNLPKNTSGIAYDDSNNKFYLSKGNELYVTNSKFKVEEFHWKSIRYNHAQDIAAYDGVFLVCTWVNGNESYIDLYRSNDGAYLGSYYVPIGEIESCFVEVDPETKEKHLIILMNNGKKVGDCLMRTVDPIALP